MKYSDSAPKCGSNIDEIFMQQSLLFADNLKELKNLRKQLYEAAEYFEVSYIKEEHKQIVVNSLKDYAVKALINTVDHLGSVAHRVTNLFDEKTADIHETDIRLQSIQQRMQTCQEYVGQGGLSQQLFLIPTPKHHKLYILPETKQVSGLANLKTNSSRLRAGNKLQQIGDEEPVTCANQFPLMRSGSLLRRSISPSNKQRNTLQPQTHRTVSLSAASGRDRAKDIEQSSGSKGKRMFKTLLSMRKPKSDGAFYKFLDEY
ncbi:hypothetical protein ACFE04_005231 [Oxalis oulophora]